MEIAELAAQVVNVLIPLVKAGTQELVGEASKAAVQKVRAFIAQLRQRWAGDVAALDTLDRFERSPDRYGPSVEDRLQEEMQAHPEFVADVERIAKDDALRMVVVQDLVNVEEATGIDVEGRVKGGSLEVQQTANAVARVRGIKIKGDIG